jgi:hypothetical protein
MSRKLFEAARAQFHQGLEGKFFGLIKNVDERLVWRGAHNQARKRIVRNY